ncbi:hypothetical protein ACK1NQ_004846 [Salmonella enterica]
MTVSVEWEKRAQHDRENIFLYLNRELAHWSPSQPMSGWQAWRPFLQKTRLPG